MHHPRGDPRYGRFFGLLLYRVICVFPGFKTAQDRIDVFEAFLDQDFRRTGRRFFSRSGAVGNNPLIRIKLASAVLYLG
jgi:hypothetical protein